MATGKRVLVVDDEAEFLSMLKNVLEARGLETVTAQNAIEAGIEIATKTPDVILMDIKMPGINGFQACEALKKNPATKNLPLVIISALSDESDMKKAAKLGIADYFVKPVNIEKLVERLKEILGID